MLADTAAPSRHLTAAPPWAYVSLLVSAVLALVTLGLIAVVLLDPQPTTPARPRAPGADPPNLVWPPRVVLARVAVPAPLGDRAGGPGGDPGPSTAPVEDFGSVIAAATAGPVPATLIVLGTLALAAAVGALAIGARYAAGHPAAGRR